MKRFKKEKCCAGFPKNFCPNTTDYFKEASFVLRAKSKYVVEIYGIGNGEHKIIMLKLSNKLITIVIAIEDGNHPVIVMPLYSKNRSISEYVSKSSNIIRFTHALKLLFQVRLSLL